MYGTVFKYYGQYFKYIRSKSTIGKPFISNQYLHYNTITLKTIPRLLMIMRFGLVASAELCARFFGHWNVKVSKQMLQSRSTNVKLLKKKISAMQNISTLNVQSQLSSWDIIYFILSPLRHFSTRLETIFSPPPKFRLVGNVNHWKQWRHYTRERKGLNLS